MPFDAAPVRQDVQNLLTLADALEREHPGFRWDYASFYFKHDCGTVGCALGLAVHIGLLPDVDERLSGLARAAERAFGMNVEDLNQVFCRPGTYGAAYYNEITPVQVAAQLRRIASEKMSQETGNDG